MTRSATLGLIAVLVGRIGTAYYFAYFLVILPWLSRNEKARTVPKSINEAVLEEKKRKVDMIMGAAE